MHGKVPLTKQGLRHRLPAASYGASGSCWHVTFGTFDRHARPLADPVVAEAILLSFSDRIDYYESRLHLCCLMPDHAHLVIQVSTKGLVDVVRDLKSVATRTWWSCGGNGKLWQESFYDRGIRGASDFEAAVAYILDNPVRAGLVESWEEYPFVAGEVVQEL